MFECRGAQSVDRGRRRAPTPVCAHRDGAKKKRHSHPPPPPVNNSCILLRFFLRCGGLGVREPGRDVEGGA